MTSYENPNYHMDPQHIERNSHLYEEILSELHHQQNNRTGGGAGGQPQSQQNNRKDYAQMGIESMGVDLKENFG